MELPTFYDKDSSSTGNFITLNEETSKHAVQVLRMQPGERLQLTDGCGNLNIAEIIDAHKKKATVKVVEKTFLKLKSRKISIAISLIKNSSRFEWFLEKATEIGVTEINPLLCERTEKQHFRFERMQQIMVSAMLQSKQVWLPKLQIPTHITKVIEGCEYSTKLIAYCTNEIKKSITDFTGQETVQILIGPEGDFTTNEIAIALKSEFIPVTLGVTRLRTETAGVVAASMLCL